jgi:hypothetical protein
MTDGSEHGQGRLSRAIVAFTWLAATAGTIALLLIAASAAEGGVYRVAQCNPGLGASHPDLSFDRNSDHYTSAAACEQGRGLTVRHSARRSRSGRWGAWTLDAPRGTTIRAMTTRVAAAASAGHEPQLLAGFPGSDPTPFGDPAAGGARWRGEGASGFEARLECTRDGGCGEGVAAKLRIRRLLLTLFDGAAPTTGLGGPLASDSTQRGTRTLTTSSTDDGSGIRRVFLAVNRQPVGARRLDCFLRRRIALRLRPCPATPNLDFTLDTAAGPFRQGPNGVRVCVLDWAPTNDRNRACSTSRVRVDNECPVDGGAEPATIEARIEGLGSRGSVRHGETAHVAGQLLAEAGGPVAGAEICVATRVDLHDAVERVVATPTTDSQGRFNTTLEAGPSREVRIAHWSDSEHVVERYLRLGVRARPDLRLRPRGTLGNGERLRFAVRLHGPEAGERRVHLKVRVGSSWRILRNGSTNESGVWHGAYRFRATSGSEVYAFRAFVPRQQGYPYDAGRSAVRKAHVSG